MPGCLDALTIRHVDAGSCNGCELEINALGPLRVTGALLPLLPRGATSVTVLNGNGVAGAEVGLVTKKLGFKKLHDDNPIAGRRSTKLSHRACLVTTLRSRRARLSY